MSETSVTPTTHPIAVPQSETRSPVAIRVLRNPAGLSAIVVLALIILVGVFADILAPADPNAPSLQNVLAPRSAEHLLGADTAGRDVLSRLLFATRFSLAGALWAVLIAAVIGVTSGLVAGYYQKWFESTSMWVVGALQALPAIVVLLAARAALGPSIWFIMAVFGIILSPAFYRLVHAAVVGVRHELYVDAARVAGVGDLSIIGRHILSVVRAPIIIQASILMGLAIALQAGLEFLGLGDQSVATWGQMLDDAFSRMHQAPELLVWPSTAIAVTSVALVLLGNAIRDELEGVDGAKPRRRKSKSPVAAGATARTVSTSASDVDKDTVVHADLAENDQPVLLQITDLVVGYDKGNGNIHRVVHGVTLDVREGEVHGLIGESGSGKTQTAWSVLDLLPNGGRIVSGAVVFDGVDLSTLDSKAMTKVRGKRIAYIPQEPMSNLDPSFTIGSQLVEPMCLTLGISRREAKAKALELLAKVGIPDPERTFGAYPHELSGGMAQRVLIAGAVSCDPDLLIADEPTTALDVTVQAEILDLLRALQVDMRVSVLIVTHNLGVVADLCERVSVMQHGRIVESGPVETVFNNPGHPYTRLLLGAVLEDGAPRGSLESVATSPAAPAAHEGDAQ